MSPDRPTHRRNERGATIVEFALVMPLLLMLIFGIIEFSIIFNNQQGLHAAAREGAREASVPTATQTDINNRVTAALVGVPLDNPPTVAITPNVTTPCENADNVVVTVTYTRELSIPFWGTQTFDIVGVGDFKCET